MENRYKGGDLICWNYIEDKLDKHNNRVERTYNLEGKLAVLEKEKDVANHRIADLEKAS